MILATLFVVLLVGIYKTEGQCSHSAPCALMGGQNLASPQQLTSSGGSLSMTLTVQVSDIKIDWLTLHRRCYDGVFPGPTWRVKRGDVVNVTVVNTLGLPHKTEAPNQLRLPNTTNLHTHGLHISSKEPQDNVFVHIHPGESYTYSYQIDSENPSGTYWYHPHLHGATLLQVHSGMAGMIIVEDDADATTPSHLRAVSCPENCAHDIQLMFQPTLQYINNGGRGFANIQQTIQDNPNYRHNQYPVTAGGNLEEWLTNQANGIDHFTTNGQLWPQLAMTTTETKRFRMVNAGGSAILELLITDTSQQPTSACSVLEIAYDGVYLDEARTPLTGKTLLIPSGKVDWLVACGTAGTYELRSLSSNVDNLSIGGFQRLNQNLLTIVVTGTSSSITVPTSLPTRPSFVGDFRSLTQDQVFGRFVIEASPGTRLNRERFQSNTNYRFKAQLNTNQEWYLVNSDPGAAHPIHIHVNHFQVISYNSYTGPYSVSGRTGYVFFDQDNSVCAHQHSAYTGNENVQTPNNPLRYLGHDARWAAGGTGTLGYSEAGLFRDAILVPPLVNITIRFNAHKYTGEVVVHCHLLNHEDTGMMLTADIVDQGADLTASIPSGTAYPGTCKENDPYPFNACDSCPTTINTSSTTTTPAASPTETISLGGEAAFLTPRSWNFTVFLILGLLQLV
uniref:ferroxidase n=3 Tax=Ciona intestinalis TaxID=7719 RepID=F6YQV7_CIOIN